MAKYMVKMSCGHDDEVELFGNGSDREKKIRYYESSGLCKECYKKMMNEKAQEEGLTFNASILPYVDDHDGSFLLTVWFSGDTMTHKDEIKSIGGYRWSDRESASDFLSTSRPVKCWNKVVKYDNLHDEIDKAMSIGAKNLIVEKGLAATFQYQLALDSQKKWKEKHDKISEIEKPVVPEVLVGHKWNQKIYGRSGNYSIYLDGDKVVITDDQADEIKLYLEKKEEYKKKVSEV